MEKRKMKHSILIPINKERTVEVELRATNKEEFVLMMKWLLANLLNNPITQVDISDMMGKAFVEAHQ